MAKIKIGAQLILWGKEALSNFTTVLDEVASIGYEGIEIGIETSPGFEQFSDPKSLLASHRLSLASLHLMVPDLSDISIVDKALSILERAGGKYLLFSGAGGRQNSDENYRQSSKIMDQAGIKARKLGVKVCYHNHWQEIINDAKGTEIILKNTSPENVSLCVDTYWVACGGLSPAEFIRKNSRRVSYLHFKDGTEQGAKRIKEGMKKNDFTELGWGIEFTELGNGIVDFPSVMEAIKPLEISWIVVEQDTSNKTPKESMAISRNYLREKLRL